MLATDEAADLARVMRDAAPAAERPLVVAITVDASASELQAILAEIDPDVVQLNGTESAELARSIQRLTWKPLHVPVGR